jgi:hypothetical protein
VLPSEQTPTTLPVGGSLLAGQQVHERLTKNLLLILGSNIRLTPSNVNMVDFG